MGSELIGGGITLLAILNCFYIVARLRKDIRAGDQLFAWISFGALLASVGMVLIVAFFWWISDTNLAIGA